MELNEKGRKTVDAGTDEKKYSHLNIKKEMHTHSFCYDCLLSSVFFTVSSP